MQIYNTLSRQKEKFKPLKQNEVKVYFCWPTPYNYAHIWNLKTYIVEDYIIKTLKFMWYKVKTVMNITDIDDKTIRDSQKAWENLIDYTKKYTNYFLKDLDKLNITLADEIVPISNLIDEMVLMINWLIKKWYAYLAEDQSVYYEIKKFKKYWKLAHLNFSWMKHSVRINNDEYDKENAADFVLWKAWRKEDWENFWMWEFLFWEKKVTLKWRPGWHIECSACNMKYFWEQIDIHMGWVDNIFPHHENEIAQSEAYFWKSFSKYWIHSGHITVDWKKMAKSANNFYTIKDLEEKFIDIPKSILYRAIRLSFMNAKYKESVDFSFEKLNQNFNNIKKIDESLKKLNNFIKLNSKKQDNKKTVRKDFREDMQNFIKDYIEKLEDDFNMPEVFSIFFQFITYTNTQLNNKELSLSEANSLLDMFKTFNEVLSLIDFDILWDTLIPKNILEKLELRNKAKKDKNFDLADSLRYEILKMWYKIIDDRNETRLEKIIK